MTLRLSDDMNDRLRREAETEQRSMQQVAVTAIAEYLARKADERVDALFDEVASTRAELLDRLGNA